METSTKIWMFFYGAVTLLNAAFCISLFAFLNWPLLAEIPFLACIFIEIQFLAKAFYSTFIDGQGEFFNQIFVKLKESLFNVEA